MRVSYNILCHLLPEMKKSPELVAQALTDIGLEVEQVSDLAASWRGIVVGEVVTREKHPNADKLSICQVSGDASGKNLQVVCGASNVTAGKKYPFATLGAVMPSGLEIKPVKLRGVDSCGMLCSAKELELAETSDGLLELSADAVVGESVARTLGREDFIFEVNVTPNRGDALSHQGIARDLSALWGLKILENNFAHEMSEIQINKKNSEAIFSLSLKIENRESCPRYVGSVVRGVKVGSSPKWLAHLLENLGLRSINNIVDATNFVMLMMGHPTHAFDLKKLVGNEVNVRNLGRNEKFKALDEREYDLLADDLVIADQEGVIALAGVIGGERSSVDDSTTDVFLETAYFKPETVQKTARRLGLKTDSSYRFERGVNPAGILQAHLYLRALIQKLAGGEVSAVSEFYPQEIQRTKIHLSDTAVLQLLGIQIPKKESMERLSALGCTVEDKGEGCDVEPPLSRPDLTRPVDLIEEIARLRGLSTIPEVIPLRPIRQGKQDSLSSLSRNLRSFFAGEGFSETVHYSFSDVNWMKKVLRSDSTENWLSLANPLSEELSVMRPSLLPSLLRTLEQNSLSTRGGLRLFECRHVYRKQGDRVSEEKILAGIFSGESMERNRFGISRLMGLEDGQGVLQKLWNSLHLHKFSVRVGAGEVWHPGQSLSYFFENQNVASLGVLHPDVMELVKIKNPVIYFEIYLSSLCQLLPDKPVQYRRLSALPPVYRDLALVVPESLTHAQICQEIESLKPALLTHVELFDSYSGAQVPAGMKSLAYSFVYQPEDESLTDEAVNKLHFDLVDKLSRQLGVTLR